MQDRKTRWAAMSKNMLHAYSCCDLRGTPNPTSEHTPSRGNFLNAPTQQMWFLSFFRHPKHVGFTQRALFLFLYYSIFGFGLVLPISPEYKLFFKTRDIFTQLSIPSSVQICALHIRFFTCFNSYVAIQSRDYMVSIWTFKKFSN